MPTLNIKDPTVHQMAHDLAKLRHTSATGAVRQALADALAAEKRNRRSLVDSLLALPDIYGTRDCPMVSDEEFYDAEGLPKW